MGIIRTVQHNELCWHNRNVLYTITENLSLGNAISHGFLCADVSPQMPARELWNSMKVNFVAGLSLQTNFSLSLSQQRKCFLFFFAFSNKTDSSMYDSMKKNI